MLLCDLLLGYTKLDKKVILDNNHKDDKDNYEYTNNNTKENEVQIDTTELESHKKVEPREGGGKRVGLAKSIGLSLAPGALYFVPTSPRGVV